MSNVPDDAKLDEIQAVDSLLFVLDHRFSDPKKAFRNVLWWAYHQSLDEEALVEEVRELYRLGREQDGPRSPA